MNQAELAKRLGTTRETVSKALNGHRPETELTRAIIELAESVGYVRPGEDAAPSMSSIARDLGLSHVAVRAAFRPGGTTKLSDETRAKILARAKEVGYKPPPAKRYRRRV